MMINLENGFQVTPPLLFQFEAGYKVLAQKKGVRFLSLLGVVSNANFKDGIHPNSSGATEIATAISAFLSTQIK